MNMEAFSYSAHLCSSETMPINRMQPSTRFSTAIFSNWSRYPLSSLPAMISVNPGTHLHAAISRSRPFFASSRLKNNAYGLERARNGPSARLTWLEGQLTPFGIEWIFDVRKPSP